MATYRASVTESRNIQFDFEFDNEFDLDEEELGAALEDEALSIAQEYIEFPDYIDVNVDWISGV